MRASLRARRLLELLLLRDGGSGGGGGPGLSAIAPTWAWHGPLNSVLDRAIFVCCASLLVAALVTRVDLCPLLGPRFRRHRRAAGGKALVVPPPLMTVPEWAFSLLLLLVPPLSGSFMS